MIFDFNNYQPDKNGRQILAIEIAAAAAGAACMTEEPIENQLADLHVVRSRSSSRQKKQQRTNKTAGSE